MANYETKAEARTSLDALDAWATQTGHQGRWDRPEEEAWHEAWLAGRDYQRQQQPDPVREALVAALELHVGKNGHTAECLGYTMNLYGCDERCQQTRAALAAAELQSLDADAAGEGEGET